jgi:LPS-assembly protein
LLALVLAPQVHGQAGRIPGFDAPLFPPQPAQPPRQPVEAGQAYLLTADSMTYDRDNEIVTATGSVEIVQGDRVLRGDTISWNRRTDVVTASGSLVLLEPNGEVVFGEYAELTQGMRDGVIREMRMLLVDNARIAAAGGRRTSGERKEFARAVFSPCDLCVDDPNRAPLWQVKADRVIHDEVARDIIYRDATMEFFGVPVFYTPYFAHADPTVRRRSGFLPPTLKQSDSMGFVVGQPYFQTLGDSADTTLEARRNSKQGLMGLAELRHRFADGVVRVAGSVAEGRRRDASGLIDRRDLNGNLVGEARWHIDDKWRLGIDVARDSDLDYSRRFQVNDTYLGQGRYPFAQERVTVGQIERFDARSYFHAAAFGFQTLRVDVRPSTLPIIHPALTYAWTGLPDSLGGRFAVDLGSVALSRQTGPDSFRVNSFSAYHLPLTTPGGLRLDFAATVQADAYRFGDVPDAATGRLTTATVNRLHPQVAAIASYPMINQIGGTTIIVEPKAGLFASPRGGNPARLVNEDSLGFEFDDTALFNLRRFAGFDRVTGGQRFDYALAGSVDFPSAPRLSGVIGQSYRAQMDSSVSPRSGVRDEASDIVGRLSLNPTPQTAISYRFRLDKDGFARNRDEFGFSAFDQRSFLSASYVRFATARENINEAALEQLTVRGFLQATNEMALYSILNFDLRASEATSGQFGLVYRDECFAIILGANRDLRSARDRSQDTTFLIRFAFRYLADLGS